MEQRVAGGKLRFPPDGLACCVSSACTLGYAVCLEMKPVGEPDAGKKSARPDRSLELDIEELGDLDGWLSQLLHEALDPLPKVSRNGD